MLDPSEAVQLFLLQMGTLQRAPTPQLPRLQNLIYGFKEPRYLFLSVVEMWRYPKRSPSHINHDTKGF